MTPRAGMLLCLLGLGLAAQSTESRDEIRQRRGLMELQTMTRMLREASGAPAAGPLQFSACLVLKDGQEQIRLELSNISRSEHCVFVGTRPNFRAFGEHLFLGVDDAGRLIPQAPMHVALGPNFLLSPGESIVEVLPVAGLLEVSGREKEVLLLWGYRAQASAYARREDAERAMNHPTGLSLSTPQQVHQVLQAVQSGAVAFSLSKRHPAPDRP